MQYIKSKADDGVFERYKITIKAGIILLAALFLLSGCGFQSGQGQNQTGRTTATMQTSKQTITTVPGAFLSLDMMSTTVGWAVSLDTTGNGSYVILRTTDGGNHWIAMLHCTSTENQGRGFMEPCATNFRSASLATVVQPEYNTQTKASQIRIFHTADGGANWQSSVLKARDLETPVTFVDAQHGWALVTENFPGPDPGSTYIGQDISLYSTSNGGQSWQRADHGLATSQLGETSDDGYGVAPLTANARMAFSSPTTGWLVGMTYQTDGSSQNWLYVTHDGGMTWQKTSLTFAAGALVLEPPTFFTVQDGILPVQISGQNTQTSMLYTTHDGGQSWSGTAVPFDITSGSWSDMEHAWASVTTTNVPASLTATAFPTTGSTPSVPINVTTLNLTSDGWQHWIEVHLPYTFTNIYDFDFASPTTGWALANNRTDFMPEPNGGLSKGDVITVLKTTDGGKTWQEISRSLV